jgi:hypothetical protein
LTRDNSGGVNRANIFAKPRELNFCYGSIILLRMA